MSRVEKSGRGGRLSRRDFILLSAVGAAGMCAGCATNPISGRRQLMFYGASDELQWDREFSPHQLSADYGAVQDPRLAAYINDISGRIVAVCHRPDMPYSFRCLNASYINAYAFPGGTIATTRGILLMMEDEAQLASVIGHEVAHVCARHAAQQMTKNLTMMGILVGASILTDKMDPELTPWVVGLGYIGSGMLLCKYSRNDEREADEFGMQYMAKAGFNPIGMSGVMDGFQKLSEGTPGILDRIFASHPMSKDRYNTAIERANSRYPEQIKLPVNRERYMDMTAGVRRTGDAIKAVQKGDDAVDAGKWDRAKLYYGDALRAAPDDYESLLKMANWHVVRQQPAEARALVKAARQAYPSEPQAVHMEGMTCVMTGSFDAALNCFQRYESMLPGNCFTLFYIGRSEEGMGRQEAAAARYQQFLEAGGEGKEAEHARARLRAWGKAVPGDET